jgi:hypothetical protein
MRGDRFAALALRRVLVHVLTNRGQHPARSKAHLTVPQRGNRIQGVGTVDRATVVRVEIIVKAPHRGCDTDLANETHVPLTNQPWLPGSQPMRPRDDHRNPVVNPGIAAARCGRSLRAGRSAERARGDSCYGRDRVGPTFGTLFEEVEGRHRRPRHERTDDLVCRERSRNAAMDSQG